MPAQDLRVRPRPAWYAVPVVMWVVALVLFVLAIFAIARVVNNGVDQLRAGGGGVWEVSVPADGLTLYTTDPNSTANCTLTPANGRAVPLETLKVTIEISINGPTYYGLGVTPDGLAPGQYKVSCGDIASNARLGTGPRVDVTALATRAIWGLVLPLVLGVVGLVVLIIVVVKRHSSKSRLRTMQAYAGSGYGGGWNQDFGSGGPSGPPGGPPPPPPPRP